MTWFKVDDSFYDHPKVFDAPDCAVALWTRAGTWSARNLTDGFVPSGMPARFCDDPERGVRELLNRGLWKRARGGYQFHDWNRYQPTAESVRSLREKRAEAGRVGGRVSGQRRSSRDLSVTENDGNGNVTSRVIHSSDGTAANATEPDMTRHGQRKRRSKPGSKDEASASPVASLVLEPPTRPLPSTKEGRGAANSLNCTRHRGQRAANCGPCRSEALAHQEDS